MYLGGDEDLASLLVHAGRVVEPLVMGVHKLGPHKAEANKLAVSGNFPAARQLRRPAPAKEHLPNKNDGQTKKKKKKATFS